MRRVVVTGMGLISPLGNDPGRFFARLMAGESGVQRITATGPRGEYSAIGAPVSFDAGAYPQLKLSGLDRATQFAVVSAADAMRDAGLGADRIAPARAGVCLGTGMGATETLEQSYVQLLDRDPDRMKPLTVLTVMNNAPAAHVALRYGLSGPNLTYSCACSSSSVAVGEAYRQIRHGYADLMMAAGTEAPLAFGMFKAWEAMRVLASPWPDVPSASCRPFSRDRSGLVLGEGAAAVVLEERDAALARGARIYAEIVGYGCGNDASHLTKPSVDAQAAVMRAALSDARVDPEAIDYVNAHGTGTPLNDPAETHAIKAVFGQHARRLAVSSTKSMHGHLLGAAGALEFIVSVLALTHGAVPPTAHLDVPDPECDLDYVPHRGRAGQHLRCALSNSFAFGGTNVALIAALPDASKRPE